MVWNFNEIVDPESNDGYLCKACAHGKLIRRKTQPSLAHPPSFLERIHVDICGPIYPPTQNFHYFMVIVDATSRLSRVYLLASRNFILRYIVQFISEMQNSFPQSSIKNIRCDNAAEFRAEIFEEYCAALGIKVEWTVPEVHQQNGLAEAHINRLQLVARPLLLQSSLPASAWGYAILHAQRLLQLRPLQRSNLTPHHFMTDSSPSVQHLRVFGCAVYIPIPKSHRTKLGQQRTLGICIGFKSPAVVLVPNPISGHVFESNFADCVFDETIFPRLGGENRSSQLTTQQRQIYFPPD